MTPPWKPFPEHGSPQGHRGFSGAENAQARAQQIGGPADCGTAHVAATSGSWAEGQIDMKLMENGWPEVSWDF